MGKTLYLEGSSGISGDMMVAALLDLGADERILKKALDSLNVEGFSVRIQRVVKSGLDVCDFDVILDEVHENHDHDMEYLHGKGEQKEPAHGHAHMHRGLTEILEIIEMAEMSKRAKNTAVRIFEILAEAEARAHGVKKEQVHFHEVGAVDSIADIIAVAVCLDNLDITETIVPYLNEGSGMIRCQHGILPVPVPAVLNIVERHQIALHKIDIEGELVTPTGAAVVAAIRTSENLPSSFVVKKSGMGAGKRQYQCPGILRAMLIEVPEQENCQESDTVCCLETNLDDCSGEALGFVMDKLLEAGARDVHYHPVFMKKNRPAYQLNVVCDREKTTLLENIIFRETTTIGIRKCEMSRRILKRKSKTVVTELGTARVKECQLPDGEIRNYPEYESVRSIAEQTGRSFPEIYDKIKMAVDR